MLYNLQSFHSTKSYLGPRTWSYYALWKFREFNELKHTFERRLILSHQPMNEYLHTFHTPYLPIGAKCLMYLSGSLLAVLLITSVIDEAILLYIHIGDHNLFWYLGIFTAIYGASNALIPDETKIVTKEEQEELVNKVNAYTHYYNPQWAGNCHTTQVSLFIYSILFLFYLI